MTGIYKTLLDAISGKEEDYTSGSINRAIVLLSIPMVLEMGMEGLFAVVDAYWVSKVSVDAVATVGLTESVLMLVYSLAIGLSAAATAMVARRVGEHNPEGAAKAAVQATFIAVAVSVAISIVGVVFAENILRLMGGSEKLIEDCSGYAKIMFGGNIVIMLIFLFNAVYRGAGNASYAMWALILSNGLNIILDPLLIFGIGPFPEMGIEGAAVATNIGRVIGVIFQLFLLLRGVGLVKIAGRHIVLHFHIIRRLIGVAMGGAGQYIIASASWIFLMRIIAQFGSEALAGYTIAIRILVFTILPAWGLANAAATLVGQNLGAGNPERAEISVWRTSHANMLFMLLISITYFFLAPFLIPVFNNSPGVVESGVMSLRIISSGYVFFAYGIVIGQAFNGAGDTKTPTLLNFICFWCIEIPLGYLLAVQLNLGLSGVCWAVAFSESLLAFLFIYVFRKGKWKLVEI
jgi:putative MATE family efflux protein